MEYGCGRVSVLAVLLNAREVIKLEATTEGSGDVETHLQGVLGYLGK
jgi:hypothetical protein